MPDSETFDAFYARTVWNVTSQMHALAGDDGTADHAIREAYARAYQQWYQVSGYHDTEGWVLATAKDAYERRRAEAGGLSRSAAAQDTDSGTWPGIYRPVAQPDRGGGQGQPLADPDATVAPAWRSGAEAGGSTSSGTPGNFPAARGYRADGGTAPGGVTVGSAQTADLESRPAGADRPGPDGLIQDGVSGRPRRGAPGRNGLGGWSSRLGSGSNRAGGKPNRADGRPSG